MMHFGVRCEWVGPWLCHSLNLFYLLHASSSSDPLKFRSCARQRLRWLRRKAALPRPQVAGSQEVVPLCLQDEEQQEAGAS